MQNGDVKMRVMVVHTTARSPPRAPLLISLTSERLAGGVDAASKAVSHLTGDVLQREQHAALVVLDIGIFNRQVCTGRC